MAKDCVRHYLDDEDCERKKGKRGEEEGVRFGGWKGLVRIGLIWERSSMEKKGYLDEKKGHVQEKKKGFVDS